MNRFDQIVDELYRRDMEEAMSEIENQPVTIRLRATHVQMLQAMAERFSQSRSALSAELLEHAVEQVFALLDPKDRESLAGKADEAYTAYAKEKYTVFENHGGGFWAAQHWAFSRNAQKSGEAE
jgi:predicted transcriptional regulator